MSGSISDQSPPASPQPIRGMWTEAFNSLALDVTWDRHEAMTSYRIGGTEPRRGSLASRKAESSRRLLHLLRCLPNHSRRILLITLDSHALDTDTRRKSQSFDEVHKL